MADHDAALQPQAPMPDAPDPKSDDVNAQVVHHLLHNMALDRSTGMAVSVFSTRIDPPIPIPVLRQTYLKWRMEVEGPRGGMSWVNPVDQWLRHPERKDVSGTRMRPAGARPFCVDDDGRVWVNSYVPKVHPDEGGDVLAFDNFIAHLLPDEAEREFFLNWLAYKLRHPGAPGCCIVLVAMHYGTGRGTMFSIIRLLIGEEYCRSTSFDIFTGQSSQAVFNIWEMETLITLVEEAQEDGASSYRAKRGVYEHIKSNVVPEATRKRFIAKGKDPIFDLAHTSYIVATNHPDALVIPQNDRRLAVLSNGHPLSEHRATEIHDWMTSPKNIGALARSLAARDLSGYSPYAHPPMTEAKRRMIATSRSDLDEVFQAVMEGLGDRPFTKPLVVERMSSLADGHSDYRLPDRWEEVVSNSLVKKHAVAILDNASKPRRIDIHGRKCTVYAADIHSAGKNKGMSTNDLRAEIEALHQPRAPSNLRSINGLPARVVGGVRG